MLIAASRLRVAPIWCSGCLHGMYHTVAGTTVDRVKNCYNKLVILATKKSKNKLRTRGTRGHALHDGAAWPKHF